MLDAVAVGVRPEAIGALVAGRDDELTPDERQLADYVRHVVSRSVTQEEYDALEGRFGVRGAVEYTAWVGHLTMTALVVLALEPGLGERMRPLAEERLRSILDGTADIPDPRARDPRAARGAG